MPNWRTSIRRCVLIRQRLAIKDSYDEIDERRVVVLALLK
jgi:hypothetical protein